MKTKRSLAPQLHFGLVAWLEETRVSLPLKGVECRFEVNGAIAGVEFDQIYYQDAARPLDCTYQFPLPAGAAVYRCELHVNGRVIRAKVEAREDAKRIYREQKAAGRRAALVETERENLFTLSLGNVQPGDVIVVRLAWFQVLDRAGDGLRLLVPTCPGVRYIPGQPLLRSPKGRGTADDTDQVPDASRLSPPRIDALHPDAAYVHFEGRLAAADVANGTLSSPSHPVRVRQAEGAIMVELASGGAVPDRDFVLAWEEPVAAQLEPQSWHWREGKETYALVQLRAPQQVKVAEDFAQDVYFLVDRSGSMEGAKWQRTCEALHAFVKLLGSQDRVWITLFESSFRDFSDAPMPAPEVLADGGFRRMERLGVDGGTELLPAARHVLQQIEKHSAGRRASVVLITDGQVGNETAVLAAFAEAPGRAVHTFGIDTAVNEAFLKTLARRQRGGCWLQTPDDDIAGTIAALGDRLRRPVLTELELRGAWEGTGEPLPDLHAREIVTVAVRGTSARTIEIAGHLPDGTAHLYKVSLAAGGGEAIKLLWARERIAHLLQAGAKPEALALAKQFNLVCEGAAFVAWDEAEQVPVAVDEVVQPALEPMRCRSLRASAPIFAAAPMRSLGECDERSFGDFCAEPAPPEERKAEFARVREEFRRAQLPEQTIESMFKVELEDELTASLRMEKLYDLERVLEFSEKQMRPLLREACACCLQKAPTGSSEELLRWAGEFHRDFSQVMEIDARLRRTRQPKPVVDRLIAWIFESGSINRKRLVEIQKFLDSLDRLPFSGALLARTWREFLERTKAGAADALAAGGA